MSIEKYAFELRLPYTRSNYEMHVEDARMNNTSYLDFLNGLLEKEYDLREQNGINRRIRDAHFPTRITLDEYQREHLSVEIQQKIKKLESLEFIEQKENIILIGNPGTGKTALAAALGLKACQQKKNVLFINIPNLLIELNEIMSRNEISQYKRKFEKYDLVICDEMGYCTFDRERAEILFNLLSNRNETGSIIITSNLTLDKWNEIFKDKVLTGAIIDRLAYKAHMIDMSGDSYRIISTKKWNKEAANK